MDEFRGARYRNGNLGDRQVPVSRLAGYCEGTIATLWSTRTPADERTEATIHGWTLNGVTGHHELPPQTLLERHGCHGLVFERLGLRALKVLAPVADVVGWVVGHCSGNLSVVEKGADVRGTAGALRGEGMSASRSRGRGLFSFGLGAVHEDVVKAHKLIHAQSMLPVVLSDIEESEAIAEAFLAGGA